MRVRLTKKYAEMIDGIDLSAHEPGDVFDLERSSARLLVAEGWAVPERRRKYLHGGSQALPAVAADRPNGRRSEN
jgi:hypothetical protein